MGINMEQVRSIKDKDWLSIQPLILSSIVTRTSITTIYKNSISNSIDCYIPYKHKYQLL